MTFCLIIFGLIDTADLRAPQHFHTCGSGILTTWRKLLNKETSAVNPGTQPPRWVSVPHLLLLWLMRRCLCDSLWLYLRCRDSCRETLRMFSHCSHGTSEIRSASVLYVLMCHLPTCLLHHTLSAALLLRWSCICFHAPLQSNNRPLEQEAPGGPFAVQTLPQ